MERAGAKLVTTLIYSLLFSLFILFFLSANSYSADIGNCLLCHKYPGLSRIDEDGRMRLLFINEEIFNSGPHNKVKCEGCHTDITEIPHKTAKKVDCLVVCHIVEPSSEQKFSHKDVATSLEKSVHGTYDKNGVLKKFPEDMPACKDCHDEPLYRPISFFKKVRPGFLEQALGRCRVCHKKEEFIQRFYSHVTTRLHKSRNPLNIAEMCGRCHDNAELVARHKLSTRAAFSYGETFHGKAARFLSEEIPDCLDCHVKEGKDVHQMRNHEDPESPIHTDNRGKICTNIDCHPDASPKLANYKVHSEFNREQDSVQYFFTLFFIVLTGGTLLPLMGIIFLDVVRRFFPHATFKRKG